MVSFPATVDFMVKTLMAFQATVNDLLDLCVAILSVSQRHLLLAMEQQLTERMRRVNGNQDEGLFFFSRPVPVTACILLASRTRQVSPASAPGSASAIWFPPSTTSHTAMLYWPGLGSIASTCLLVFFRPLPLTICDSKF